MGSAGKNNTTRSSGTEVLSTPVKDGAAPTGYAEPSAYPAKTDYAPADADGDQRSSLRIKHALNLKILPKKDLAGWLIGASALLLGAVFVATDLAYNQGNLIAPLDDVYIHMQYASQLGRGHFLQYNTGDPISTGASSLLYILILAFAYALGFQGSLLLPFAVGFGVLCLALTAVCVYALGRRLVDTEVGIWAGLLVAVSGPLLWGATSGMEVGLVALLVASTLLFFAKEAPQARFVLTPVLATLLALVRTEGLIFATVLIGAMCWLIFRTSGTGVRGTGDGGTGISGTGISGTASGTTTQWWGRGWARVAWTLLPLAAGAGQLLLFKIATGTMTANGVQSKSYLFDLPVFYPTEFIDRVIINLRGFLEVFGGLNTREFIFPGAVFFIVLGIVYLMVAKRATWRPLVIAIVVGLLAVLLSISTLISAHVHNLRYAQPFLPIFILFAVTGVYGVTRALVSGRTQRIGMHGLLAMVLVFSLAAVPTWAIRLGHEAATIRETDVSVGSWIKGNLPPDVSVGVKDVGAVKYFSDHHVVDVIGLATNGLAKASNNGIGTLYEALRHLPAEQRPDYFAVYDSHPGPPMDDMRDTGIFVADPLITFAVKSPLPTSGGLVVPFQSLSVYRADWGLAGTGDQARTPGTLRDYLNVGDLDSERTHDYEPRLMQVGMQPFSVLRRVRQPDGRDIVDSGRRIIGGERFTAHNIMPGRPLTITSRAAAGEAVADDPIGPLPDLQILIDGVPAGIWYRPVGDNIWHEDSFTIPGHLITESTVELELAPPRPLLSPYPDYTSFGYWLSQ